jgi:hypothetical protein
MLPNLTANNVVGPPPPACKRHSAIRLVIPITLIGVTALSVEISTSFFTPPFRLAVSTLSVPSTLLVMASSGAPP